MNGFEKHNLKHTSPSQINMWEESPAAWGASYLYGHKFSFGVAAQIGVLTEQVVAAVLSERESFSNAVEQAEKTFTKNNALNTSQKDLGRIGDIAVMAEQAIEVLKPYGKPDFPLDGQHKIEIMCKGDGWQLPVIGYIDFYYPDQGLIVDLKTTLRMPSTMTGAHLRQGAIYQAAMGNKAVKFLYVTPKKTQVFDIENGADHLAEIKGILNRQEKMLRAFSHEELKQVLPLNLGSFYWNGAEHTRKELYGI